MWKKRDNTNLSWVIIYKISLNQPVPDKNQINRVKYTSTTIPGKTQPKSENKSMPLPDQTKKKTENTPLKNWRGSRQTNIGLQLFQLILNQN